MPSRNIFSTTLSLGALEWAIALAQHTVSTTGPSEPPAAELVHYLLYCSAAVRPFSEAELADLLEESQANNSRDDITGLLCYDQGHFVQVLEGSAKSITRLFDRILADPRHHKVRLLCRGSSTCRQFDDWHMAFTKADSRDFYWTISFLEAQQNDLLLPQVPVPEPHLPPLLYSFSRTCDHLLPRPGPVPRSYVGGLPFYDALAVISA
ncbi:MAG TPA: BLUF domain-containing protein [Hymenobacter sp.]|uniref:BLUF domain-containing protein n=1 Tax=Hymenobacter sp. TaxID=1898978 RepID=UPI002D7EF814|nr:BLUF domain-containing protein [Hymenobacter sp.]HET9505406.1 BLUF domain-containing protein [Hymenobacter sp.]